MDENELKMLGASPTAFRFEQHRDLRVEWRGDETWAIVDGGSCLNNEGEWEYEPLPSNRTEEFIARTRFSLDDALRRAYVVVVSRRPK